MTAMRAILFVSLLLSSDVFATSRMADVEIRDDHGIPCFTISKEEEHRAGTPNLGALEVYDATIKPVREIWSFDLYPPSRRYPLTSSSCIRYGEAPDGSESKPAEVLEAGKIYEVFLNARSADPSDSTAGYESMFCLIVQVDGTRKVHRLVFNDGWHVEQCQPEITHTPPNASAH